MGVFSSLFVQPIRQVQRAVIDALALSLMADGSAHQAELSQGVGFIVGLTQLDAEQAQALLAESMARVVASPDRAALISSIAQRLPDVASREAALFAAAFVQYVDGQISEQEDALIADLAQAFGLDEDAVARLIEEVELQLEEAYGAEGEDA